MRRIKSDWHNPDLYKGKEYVLADPPWNYGDRRPKASSNVSDLYPVWGEGMTGNSGDMVRLMSLFDVCTTTVFLWCTWSILEEVVATYAFSTPSVPQNQFTLRNVVTWVKLKEHGGLKFGLGNSIQDQTENWFLN